MRETISEIIEEAGDMFATLQADVAQAIIAMVVTISFVGLPILIMLLMFFHSVIVKIKNDIIRSRERVVHEVNMAYANKVATEDFYDDNVDTQPIFVIPEFPVQEKKQYIAPPIHEMKKIPDNNPYRISPEKIKGLL